MDLADAKPSYRWSFAWTTTPSHAYHLDRPSTKREEQYMAIHDGEAVLEVTSLDARSGVEMKGFARRTVGMGMLAVVVFLWTASSFLGSAVLADNSYNKPFFLTYLNTSFFTFLLLPHLFSRARRRAGGWRLWVKDGGSWVRRRWSGYEMHSAPATGEDDDIPDDDMTDSPRQSLSDSRTLLLHDPTLLNPTSPLETTTPSPSILLLSLPFSILWFLANYTIALSLALTTVASSTILTSTSSIFTLLLGTIFRVELFTYRKLLGILASLAGIVLVSSVDFSGRSGDSDHRGDFPEKSPKEMALGNVLSLGSAAAYGAYTVLMKKRIPDERVLDMRQFLGCVGLWNVVLLWPFLLILHLTRLEPFVLFPDKTITAIVLINCLASLLADVCWAYAVVLTSPIVVTVGLSLTIPLSLVGQMVLNGQTATVGYWVGACVVVASFVFVNQEEKKDEEVVREMLGSGVLERGVD